MIKNISILDCTFRDGGYINDWNFTKEFYTDATIRLQEAGIDFIEIGIMGSRGEETFKTKYQSIEEIVIPDRVYGSECKFAVMMTGTEYGRLNIPKYSDGIVDCIRYAFFKSDKEVAIDNMVSLINKGYCVFAQAMATVEYSVSELKELVCEINRIKPYAFYIVDSFGTMYNDDVSRMVDIVASELDSSILFGFHAHNNLQMANSNVIEFISKNVNRSVIVDGTMYGMGRGAGNASTELIMHYLNQHGASYKIDGIWKTITDYVTKIKEEYGWGYTPEQYLAAFWHTNPAYIWYLSKKGITEFDRINRVFERIPVERRYTLDKTIIDNILKEDKNLA